MIRRVDIGAAVLEQANGEFGESRSPGGLPSEFDFVDGPLAAAVLAFRNFDELRYEYVAGVRSYTVVDPFFGPVVFVGVLRSDDTVEIVEFAQDPDYWRLLEEDPD